MADKLSSSTTPAGAEQLGEGVTGRVVNANWRLRVGAPRRGRATGPRLTHLHGRKTCHDAFLAAGLGYSPIVAKHALPLVLLAGTFLACGFEGQATQGGVTALGDAGGKIDPSRVDAGVRVDGGCPTCDAAVDAPDGAADGGDDDADVPSLLSPSNATGSLTFQRTISWTLAARSPTALLHYTTDGTAPSTSSASATGQVTLIALPDAARIQWLVGNNPAVHSFEVHVQPNLSAALHAIIENVTFEGTGSPWKSTSAGAKVTGTAKYQVWSQSGCPACIDQVTVGIASAEACLVSAEVGLHAGESGTVSFAITAPNAPGTYPVRMGITQQLNCTPGAPNSAIGTGLSSTVIGAIVVK